MGTPLCCVGSRYCNELVVEPPLKHNARPKHTAVVCGIKVQPCGHFR